MNRTRPTNNSRSSSSSQIPRTSTSASCSSNTPSLIERLSILEGGNSAFRHQLKVLLVEVNIISDWIEKQFGVSLINKDSEIFKCMNNYDDELVELADELSLATAPAAAATTSTTVTASGVRADTEEEDSNAEEESFPYYIKIEHEMVGDEEDYDEIDDGRSMMMSLTKDEEDDGETDRDLDHHERRPGPQPRADSAISPRHHRGPRRGFPSGNTKKPTQQSTIKTHWKTNANANSTRADAELPPPSLPLILYGNYFTVQDINSNKINARCNICTEEQPKVIQGTARSTSNFVTHLKRCHPEVLADYEIKKQEMGPTWKKMRRRGLLPDAAAATTT